MATILKQDAHERLIECALILIMVRFRLHKFAVEQISLIFSQLRRFLIAMYKHASLAMFRYTSRRLFE